MNNLPPSQPSKKKIGPAGPCANPPPLNFELLRHSTGENGSSCGLKFWLANTYQWRDRSALVQIGGPRMGRAMGERGAPTTPSFISNTGKKIHPPKIWPPQSILEESNFQKMSLPRRPGLRFSCDHLAGGQYCSKTKTEKKRCTHIHSRPGAHQYNSARAVGIFFSAPKVT